MNEIVLTKDSDALICVLYREYLQRREAGASKRDAKWFGGAEHIQAAFIPKWSIEDVAETCWELSRAGLLACQPGDNTVTMAVLEDCGITYMEGRFKGNLKKVLEYISKLIPILPL